MALKRILSFCTSVIICIAVLSSSVYASDGSINNVSDASDKIQIDSFVQQIISEENMGEITNVRELYNVDNDVVAYCLEFANGYMILDLYGEIVEYSECNSSPFADIIEDIYYSGPLSYYTKENNRFVEVYTEDAISYTVMKERTDYFSQISEENNVEEEDPGNSISLMSLKTTTSTTSDGLRKVKTALTDKPRCFDYYTDGHCGRVAVTTLLFYYYDNINSSILKSTYANNPRSLYNFLGNYIFYYASYDNIKNGLTSAFPYISNDTYDIETFRNGMSSSDTLETWGKYKYILTTRSIPAILLLHNHPSYFDHWVVAYGVIAYYDSNNNIVKRQYVVNNGFQKNDIKIGHQYVAGYIHLS